MAFINHWEPNGLHRMFSGHVSGAEILTSNIKLHSDVRFKDLAYIINDFSEITDHAIETVHTEVYAATDEMISRTKHALKIALVVPQPHLQDLAQNYCNLMREQIFECDIFHAVEDARQWVNN